MTDITQKQYLLTTEKAVLPGMQEHSVGKFYLYTHPLLQVQTVETANEQTVILLGHAYCMDASEKAVAEDVRRWDGKNAVALTRFWTGRWTLITEKELITDASGLMAAFYSQTETGWYVSSSPALLAKVTGKQSRGTVKETGISWVIVPDCIINGAKTLLCTQRLLLGDKLQIAAKNWITDCRAMPTDEKCKAMAQMLVNAVKNMHSFSGRELVLALTGGKDSRVTLAALIKAGVPFTCYTAQHENISSADVSVPKKICAAYKIPYTYIKRDKTDKTRLWDYIRFTAGNSNGADAQFFAHGQFDKLPDNAIVIRSGLYEAGQVYARGYTGADMETFTAGMVRYYSELTQDPRQKEAFSAWLKNTQVNPIAFVDIRDRFYIEQRVGGWAAAIEQSLDINSFVSIQIANCAQLLSVLLSATEQERKDLTLSFETMRKLAPGVLALPVNKRSVFDRLIRIKGILKDPAGKIKKYLVKKRR